MAKVTITIANAGTGTQFLLSTTRKPDSVRLQRVREAQHLHRASFPLEVFRTMQKELGLRPQMLDHPIELDFEIEDRDRDSSGLIDQLKADLAAAQEAMTAKDREFQLAQAQQPEPIVAPSALTDDEAAMLKERDALIGLLAPYKKSDNDTPVSVLHDLIRRLQPDVTAHPDKPEPTGDTTGVSTETETPPEFDPEKFLKQLPNKSAELKGLAAPLGIVDYQHMTIAELKHALLEAEAARHSTTP